MKINFLSVIPRPLPPPFTLTPNQTWPVELITLARPNKTLALQAKLLLKVTTSIRLSPKKSSARTYQNACITYFVIKISSLS